MDVEGWMEQMTLPGTVARMPDPCPARNAPESNSEAQFKSTPQWVWPVRLYAPALLGAALLWLCFFPMAWGWIAWVAVVPLLTMLRSWGRPWALYSAALVNGMAFYLAALRWMPVADDRMYATW